MNTRKPRLLDENALWDYAVKTLAGRACSTAELKQKLRARAERLGDIDTIVARLKDCGYLDDRRFAESFAGSRLENDRLGRARVRQDLMRRRVAAPVAERAVQNLYKDVDEVALIEEHIRRKYRMAPRQGLFREDKDLAAAYRRLLRAGFSSGNVIRVLKRFAKDPDLLDSFEPPEPAVEEPS